jgi:hypothetical protein
MIIGMDHDWHPRFRFFDSVQCRPIQVHLAKLVPALRSVVKIGGCDSVCADDFMDFETTYKEHPDICWRGGLSCALRQSTLVTEISNATSRAERDDIENEAASAMPAYQSEKSSSFLHTGWLSRGFAGKTKKKSKMALCQCKMTLAFRSMLAPIFMDDDPISAWIGNCDLSSIVRRLTSIGGWQLLETARLEDSTGNCNTFDRLLDCVAGFRPLWHPASIFDDPEFREQVFQTLARDFSLGGQEAQSSGASSSKWTPDIKQPEDIYPNMRHGEPFRDLLSEKFIQMQLALASDDS